jgi:hypothetical protein
MFVGKEYWQNKCHNFVIMIKLIFISYKQHLEQHIHEHLTLHIARILNHANAY